MEARKGMPNALMRWKHGCLPGRQGLIRTKVLVCIIWTWMGRSCYIILVYAGAHHMTIRNYPTLQLPVNSLSS